MKAQSTIRNRFYFTSLALVISICALAVLSANKFRSLSQLELETQQSQSWMIQALEQDKTNSQHSMTHKDFSEVEDENRRLSLKNFFLPEEKLKQTAAKEALALVLKNERAFQTHVQNLSQNLKDQIQFLFLIGLTLLCALGTYLIFEFHVSIRQPLQTLSQRMTDFLDDRFSYEYSLPKRNELGQLQEIFNNLAQRVIKNMAELQTLDHAKSEFLSIASHELRTPLTSIKGSLSLLKGSLEKERIENQDGVERLLGIARDETERLIRLINDLLDLAKIEAGQSPLEPTWSSFGALCQRTFDGLNGLSHQANIPLEIVCDEEIEILVDSDQIQQVLTNLLSNAIKFSPEGSSVQVQVQKIGTQGEHSFIEVGVVDRGKGIAPEDQEAIFQKFRQATSSTSRLVKGTGLGLAIAKAIVEEHGGQIGVRSIPNQGSTFYFTLPHWRPQSVNCSLSEAI